MPPQGSPTPRARHAAPARHGRSTDGGRGTRGGGRPGGGRGSSGGRGRRPGRGLGRAGVFVLVVLGLLVAGGGGAAIAMMATTSDTGTDASPGRSAANAVPASASGSGSGSDEDAGLPSSPTMLASIARVDSGDQVVVDVAGRQVPVHILGVAAPAGGDCGADAALAFANEQLAGQMVTLVPDPTVPQVDDQGRRLAYVVLRSQLSYTDAALTAGVARADTSRPLWYAEVFAREQSEAVDAEKGIWGAPCRATP